MEQERIDEEMPLQPSEATEAIYVELSRDFRLDDGAMERVAPAAVLSGDERVRPFLKRNAGERRFRGIGLSVLIVAATAAVVCLGNWRLFGSPALPETREPGKPAVFANVAAVPGAFRGDVVRINEYIAKEQFKSAYEGMKALLPAARAADAPDGAEAARPLREWLLSELVVLSDGVGGGYGDAGEWFGELGRLEEGRLPPFRVMEAYLHVVQQSDPGAAAMILPLLEDMRREYGPAMNRSGRLLAMEARAHLAAMPVWRKTEPAFSQHWRRAGVALRAFRELKGADTPEYWELEAARWQRLEDCFYVFDGKQSKVLVDGNEYTWEQAHGELGKYRALLASRK